MLFLAVTGSILDNPRNSDLPSAEWRQVMNQDSVNGVKVHVYFMKAVLNVWHFLIVATMIHVLIQIYRYEYVDRLRLFGIMVMLDLVCTHLVWKWVHGILKGVMKVTV